MRKPILLLFLFLTAAFAASTGADLLAAARKGQTDKVSALLAKGAPIESTDKDGRTPLMLAAQRGHAETVKLLLEHGAKAGARDRRGWTAYGLAVFSSAADRDAVLKALPPHPPVRVTLEATWSPENLYTSCFLPLPQLTQQVAATQPDVRVAAALRDFAAMNGRHLMEFVESGGEATLKLKVRPGVSCLQQQSTDNVTLAIDATLTSNRDNAEVMQKTFGGGFKGLHARAVTSPVQYGPMFEEWAKGHAGPIYWEALEAWLRHQ